MNAISKVRTAEILLRDARGINLPKDFAEDFVFGQGPNQWQGVKEEDRAYLAEGPDQEYYWETWDDVLQRAFLINKDGLKYTLYQDGDLWVVPDMPCAWFELVSNPAKACEIDALEAVAETLATGRRLRLEGKIELAAIHEASAENALSQLDEFDADDLLTVWECSMADDPFEIEEWQAARDGEDGALGELES